MRPLSMRLTLGCGLAALALLAACENPFALPDPTRVNEVDTLSLWALSGTALQLPSAYVIPTRSPVRTDQTAGFDFAFDIAPGDEARLLPTGALGISGGSALQLTTTPFAALELAPTGGYVFDGPVAVTVGTVVIARSRPDDACVVGSLPYYAKLHVLAVDLSARRLDVEILANANCGYRDLGPGLPSR